MIHLIQLLPKPTFLFYVVLSNAMVSMAPKTCFRALFAVPSNENFVLTSVNIHTFL